MTRITLEPLPHREAIEYLRSKGFAHELQRFHHLDHFREEHARNWVVAKAMREDVTRAIRAEVERALTEGRTLQQFQEDLAPRLIAMGWWGKDLMEDPVTGETVEVQLGSMNRLRTIFDTNMRTAHAAGHWAAIWRTRRAFPFLHYIQIDRPTKRHDHERFHDKIWPVEDPIWQRIYPPNGYFCGCTVIQRTAGWMERQGRTVDPAPDLDEVAWTNSRSGEVYQIPRGVTPGFDTNPGAVWLDGREAWARVASDLEPERRAAEYGLIEGLRLRRLSEQRETLIVTDGASRPVSMLTAAPDRPDRITLDDLMIPAEAAFLHSHLSATTLSVQDIETLFLHDGASITAISPDGSIWRALRGTETPRRAEGEFIARAMGQYHQQLAALEPEEGRAVYQHALMLWLERKGVITYLHEASERNRQIFDRNADLIRSLSDDRLLPDA